MNELYSHYLVCFYRGLVVDRIGDDQYTVTSHSCKGRLHMVHYDGTGLPVCQCEAAGPCSHMAAVCAFVHSDIQAAWDQRRIFEAKSLQLQIRQGKVNPRRYPRIRREMDRINERFPRAASLPLCTRCGLVEAGDMCAKCCAELLKIWPDDPQFARELEQETADEAMRLSLGMGE